MIHIHTAATNPEAKKIHAYLFAQSPNHAAGWVVFADVIYRNGESERIAALILPSLTANVNTSLRAVEAAGRAYFFGLRAARSVVLAESVWRTYDDVREYGPVMYSHTFEETPDAPTHKR